MLFDFLVLNSTGIFTASILLSIFKLNDERLYLILGLDLIFNQLPIVTLVILGLYMYKNLLFKHIVDTFVTRYLLMLIYYFIFGFLIYGIYNGINKVVFTVLFNNLLVNLLIYYIGIKQMKPEYN